MNTNGDDHLSVNDKIMWSIHQYILFKWHTFTIFKYQMYNRTSGQEGLLEWFVPKNTTYTDTIVMWLKNELQQFEIEPSDYTPGSNVNIKTIVLEYSGLTPYIEQEQSEAIAHQALLSFKEKLKGMKKENEQ